MRIATIIILFFNLRSYSQGTLDCFEEANIIREQNLEHPIKLNIEKNAELISKNIEIVRQKIVGCKFLTRRLEVPIGENWNIRRSRQTLFT